MEDWTCNGRMKNGYSQRTSSEEETVRQALHCRLRRDRSDDRGLLGLLRRWHERWGVLGTPTLSFAAGHRAGRQRLRSRRTHGAVRNRPQASRAMKHCRDSRFGLTLQALLVFVGLDVGFRLFGFPCIYRIAQHWSSRRTVAPSGGCDPVVGRTLDAVRVATRYYWRRRLDCLPRAMAVHLLLRYRGVPATLCIGVKRFPFAAHAWVECEGRVLDGSVSTWRHEPYVPIVTT